jgi:hypothetical protein
MIEKKYEACCCVRRKYFGARSSDVSKDLGFMVPVKLDVYAITIPRVFSDWGSIDWESIDLCYDAQYQSFYTKGE